MARINSELELKEYALRQLGKPVINIEIDEIQMSDAIDDALQQLLEYHIDGYEKAAIYHEIKKSEYDEGFLTLPENIMAVTQVFNSDAYSSSVQAINDYQYQFSRDFYWGTLASGASGSRWDLVNYYAFREYLGTVDEMLNPDIWFSFNTITKHLKTNRTLNVNAYEYDVHVYSESPNYIVIQDDISGVAKKDREVDIDGTLYTIESVEVDDTVSPSETTIYFKNDVVVSPAPTTITIYVGNLVAVFTYKEIDDTAEKIYNNEWVKEYVVERFRLQWGSNLRKYKGVKLPGGVEFSGEEIYKEAKENLKELKEELHTRYQEPPDLFIG